MSARPQVGIERLPVRRLSNEPRESMNCKSCRKRKVGRPLTEKILHGIDAFFRSSAIGYGRRAKLVRSFSAPVFMVG